MILFYTIQHGIHNIYAKFQNLRCSISSEIVDEKNVYTHTHTHNYWNGKTYIPLYTSYTGGIIGVGHDQTAPSAGSVL